MVGIMSVLDYIFPRNLKALTIPEIVTEASNTTGREIVVLKKERASRCPIDWSYLVLGVEGWKALSFPFALERNNKGIIRDTCAFHARSKHTKIGDCSKDTGF